MEKIAMRSIYHMNASSRHLNNIKYGKSFVRILMGIAILMSLLLTNRLLCPLKSTYDNMHRGMDIISVMALVPKWTLANANLRQSHGLWVMTISNDSVLTRIIPGTYEQIYCYFNKMLELEKASYVPESGCCKDHLKTREGLVRRAKLG